jgi:hypothetical protein
MSRPCALPQRKTTFRCPTGGGRAHCGSSAPKCRSTQRWTRTCRSSRARHVSPRAAPPSPLREVCAVLTREPRRHCPLGVAHGLQAAPCHRLCELDHHRRRLHVALLCRRARLGERASVRLMLRLVGRCDGALEPLRAPGREDRLGCGHRREGIRLLVEQHATIGSDLLQKFLRTHTSHRGGEFAGLW